MKEIPILFSGPMIQPLLDGAKTQTRRLVTTRHSLDHIGPRGSQDDPDAWGYFFDGPAHHGWMVLGRGHNESCDNGMVSIRCPYGEVGDRLWVRETWCLASEDSMDGAYHSDGRPRGPDSYEGGGKHFAFYRATDKDIVQSDGSNRPGGSPWRPSLHMPRWASRIMLEVTEVRVQRLQEISEDDARAEGVAPFFELFPAFALDQQIIPDELQWHHARAGDFPYRASFAATWDEINGDRALWLTNPWVWAVTFKRLET